MSNAVGIIETIEHKIEVESWTMWARDHALYPNEGVFEGVCATGIPCGITFEGRAHLSQDGESVYAFALRLKVREQDGRHIKGTFYPTHPVMVSGLTTEQNDKDIADANG